MGNETLKIFNWESNPFTYKIIPELSVGYGKEESEINKAISNGFKFSMLLGPTGSGKTTLLKSIISKINGPDHVIYLPKPPKNPEDWVGVFNNVIKRGFLASLFSRSNGLNLYNLSDRVNKKLKDRKCLLFVDECHEASLDSLEWLRTLTDQIGNLSIVLAGLPVFENTLKTGLETFRKRINTRITLGNLTRAETREMIKKRVESIGGDDIKPFTVNTIEYIYEKTGGFPRDILKLCNELLEKAVERNISTIDTEFLAESDIRESKLSMDTVQSLPERQRVVLDILSKKGELTPSQIISNIDLKEYKSKDNAVRAVNNLLRRLMKEKLVERKRVGKSYKYLLSEKLQTLMVEA